MYQQLDKIIGHAILMPYTAIEYIFYSCGNRNYNI